MTRSFLLLLPLAACGPVEREDAVLLDGPIQKVEITLDYGTVDLVADDAERARVERDLSCTRWDPPSSSVELRDGTLFVLASAGGEPGRGCTADHRVYVPADVTALVNVGSGDVTVSGPAGGLGVQLGEGDVTVDDVGGDADIEVAGTGDVTLSAVDGTIRATTAAGTILGADLGSPDVVASTARGAVDLALVGDVEALDARAGTGDVDLRVPAGAYALDLTSEAGTVTTEGVTADPRGPLLHAYADGDVRVVGE